jgi:ribosomal protein S4
VNHLTVFPVGLALKEGYERKREYEKFKDYAKRLNEAQQLNRYYVGEVFSRALHT